MIHDISQSAPLSILNESNKAEYKNWNVWNMSWSHDNQVIAFCEENNNKLIFSKADTGAFIKSYTVCDEGTNITDLCFSSDSSKVAYGCTDGTVWVFNLKNKMKELIQCNHQSGVPILSVQFNNNDTYLASASLTGLVSIQCSGEQPGTIQLFDKTSRITCMKFSFVKSTILATAYEHGIVIIWDLSTQSKKKEFLAHASAPCTGISFSPVNNLLLCTCGLDGKIQFFDINTGKNVKTIENPNPLSAISFCSDGHTISVGSIKGKIFIYDLKEKQKIKNELKGQEGKKVNCLHFQRVVKDASKTPSLMLLMQSSSISQRHSQERTAIQKTLIEVQNTTQSQQPKVLNIKQNVKSTTQLGNMPITVSQVTLKSKGSTKDLKDLKESNIQKVIDEKTIKFIEEQKIDDTKRRLEQQLQQLQEEMKLQPLNLGGAYPQQESSQITSVSSNQTLQQSIDMRRPQLSLNIQSAQSSDKSKQLRVPNIEIPQRNVIKEEKKEDSDDDLMEELSLRKINKNKKGEEQMSSEAKKYFEQLMDEKSSEFTSSLQNAINNLHIELIRNFQIQEDDLRESLEKLASVNKKRRKELKYLREENKKLRQISY